MDLDVIHALRTFVQISWVPLLLGAILAASELALVVFRRPRHAGSRVCRDHGTLFNSWLWIGLAASAAGTLAYQRFPAWAVYGPAPAVTAAAFLLFAAGMAVRWWAIVSLGRSFTVTMAVHHGQRLVTSGLFRLVRHPSYAGLLLALLGIGVALESATSCALLMLAAFLAQRHRWHLEERMLLQEFPDEYRTYQSRTKRIVPFVY